MHKDQSGLAADFHCGIKAECVFGLLVVVVVVAAAAAVLVVNWKGNERKRGGAVGGEALTGAGGRGSTSGGGAPSDKVQLALVSHGLASYPDTLLLAG